MTQYTLKESSTLREFFGCTMGNSEVAWIHVLVASSLLKLHETAMNLQDVVHGLAQVSAQSKHRQGAVKKAKPTRCGSCHTCRNKHLKKVC